VALATTRQSLAAPLEQYATTVGAARTLSLHLPGEFDAAGIRGLARHTAPKLREVGQESTRPHFLMAGPNALAALIGAGSNANGPLVMPFWNGTAYVSPLVVGGATQSDVGPRGHRPARIRPERVGRSTREGLEMCRRRASEALDTPRHMALKNWPRPRRTR
jgi:hypothetical protein